MMKEARAYIYHSEWVADCPRYCGNVEYLFNKQNPRRKNSPRTLRKAQFVCSYCNLIAPIEWPENEHELMNVLMIRPVPHTRNWYPLNHQTAIKYNVAHGQTIKDLVQEAIEHGVMPKDWKRAL